MARGAPKQAPAAGEEAAPSEAAAPEKTAERENGLPARPRAPRKRAAPKAPAGETAGKRPRKARAAAKRGAENAKPAPPASPRPPPTIAELVLSRSAEDMERLSVNLTEAVMRANAVLSSSLQAQPNAFRVDPFDAQSAVGQAIAKLAEQPETLVEAQAALWMRYASIWQEHTTRWMTGGGAREAAPRDKRFRDPEWQENPYFALLRDTYLATAEWVTDLVGRAEGLDEATRRKAGFFVKQAVDAASPSNFLLTNPTALRATLETRGENLVKGLQHLADDLQRGKGMLAIRQTDLDAFRVGDNVAVSPGKVVFRNDLLELLQYDPATEQVHAVPLLIFPPWINKFYILDLQEKNSLIRWLVGQGYTVFVASWANPDARLAEATFEDYIRDGVFAATDAALRAAGAEKINAVGYCVGGTLLATALAYMAHVGDRRIASATFFAAQMDFKMAGELLVFTDDAAIKYVSERIEAAGGFLDSQAMADTFNALRSNDLVWNYVVENYYLGKRPPPFDLLYWNADQTRMPRALHLCYLRQFYHDNELAEGKLKMLGVQLSLRDVKIPIYMQSSKEDHISPAVSVYRSAKLFGGPVRYVLAGSGHIAGVINPPAAKKYQHWTNAALPDTLQEWLADAKEHPGSWWPNWDHWLKARSGELVPARVPGDHGLAVLGDAPGGYVLVKSQD